jgi:hypothetical protein
VFHFRLPKRAPVLCGGFFYSFPPGSPNNRQKTCQYSETHEAAKAKELIRRRG